MIIERLTEKGLEMVVRDGISCSALCFVALVFS